MTLAGTRFKNHPTRKGLTQPSKAGPVWNGKVRVNDKRMDDPYHWRDPRRIFVAAHSDLFYSEVPDLVRVHVFEVASDLPRHLFMILTKRAREMREFIEREGYDPLPNVMLGFSAENQRCFDQRWHDVEQLSWAGWRLWCSMEPLLGPIDAWDALFHKCFCPECGDGQGWEGELCHCGDRYLDAPGLEYVVAGHLSGKRAKIKPDPDIVRRIRDDCANAGVLFHFKQWGGPTSKSWGRELDGRTHDDMPAL